MKINEVNLTTHTLVAAVNSDGVSFLYIVPLKWIEDNNIECFQTLYDEGSSLLDELYKFPDLEPEIYSYFSY